jgi:putative spermidine/putrescine transport system permease protein
VSEDAINGASRAAVPAVLLIIIAVVALGAYRLLVRRGMRWFGGRIGATTGIAKRTSSSARPRWATRLVLAALTVYLVLPLGAVVLHSLATTWTDKALPDGYTLDNWISTWTDERATNAVITSLVLAAVTTALTLLLVVPAVYTARVVNRRVRAPLEIAAAIPFALPFLVIGLAILQFSGIVAPSLQGTMPLLIAAYVSVTFPFVYWAVDSAMAAADVETLSEAAAVAGASRTQTIVRVVLPNIRAGLTTGAMLCFATVVGEFAIVSVLASSVNSIPVWSTHMLLARQNPGLAPLSVVTLTVFALLLVGSFAVARTTRGLPEVAAPSPASEL